MRMRGVGERLPARERVLDAVEETLWPTRCVGCDAPGELLCEDCRRDLLWIDQRWACPNCGAPFGRLTCTQCDAPWELRTVVCALTFRGTAARMVTCLKDQHETRLAGVVAAAMATALDEASGCVLPDGTPRFRAQDADAICFVPATSEAYLRRGFDHMELVARHLSRQCDLPVADVLARRVGRDQRRLGRQGRERNLQGAVEVLDDVSGMRLLLIDDVVTTGASMRACTQALLARGAASVTGCALARVW